MKSAPAALLAGALTMGMFAPAASVDAQSVQEAARRIEVRSMNYIAIALVNGDQMTIHLSRVLDNAPVNDASVTVRLRGTGHPATAATDGSYALRTPDLKLPGAASVEFQIVRGAVHETLPGLLPAAATKDLPAAKNSARQLGWWVLNFSVCGGFLWLLSRRRKAAAD